MSGTQSSSADLCDTLDRLPTTPRRRFVLSYLKATRRTVALDELVTALDTWERVHRDPDTPTTRDEHRLGLRHVHLPVLSEADLVRFDADAEVVALTVDPERLSTSLGRPGSQAPVGAP